VERSSEGPAELGGAEPVEPAGVEWGLGALFEELAASAAAPAVISDPTSTALGPQASDLRPREEPKYASPEAWSLRPEANESPTTPEATRAWGDLDLETPAPAEGPVPALQPEPLAPLDLQPPTPAETARAWGDLDLEPPAPAERPVPADQPEASPLPQDLQSAAELAVLGTDDLEPAPDESASPAPAPGSFSAAEAPHAEAPGADSPVDGEPPRSAEEPGPPVGAGDYHPRAAANACVERALATEVPADRAAALLAAAGLLARGVAPADEVRALLEIATETDPDSAEVFRARARVEASLGDAAAAARALLSASIRSEGEDAGAAALEAARLFEEVGAPAEAARAYRAALHAEPGSPAARLALAEAALESGEPGAAAEHLRAIDAAAVPDGEGAEHARRQARAFERAGCGAEAERAWRAVLEWEPGDAEAFDRAEALAVEAAVRAGGPTGTRAATPTATSQGPQTSDLEPQEEQKPATPEAWSLRPEAKESPTSTDSLESWLEIARSDPSDARALREVASLAAAAAQTGPADRARLAELARLAASLAAFASPGDSPPAPRAQLAPFLQNLRERVAAPGATGALSRLLSLLSPFLEPLFPADLTRRGATPADRLAPPRGVALRAALDDARDALRGRPFAAFLSAVPGAELAIENTRPPALVVGADAEALAPDALAFAATRAVDLLEHGWALVGKFAPRDVGILLELACRFAGGTPPSQGLPAERAGAFLGALEGAVPQPIRAGARALARDASAELARTDARAFAAALRRTANRVALLRCGSPGAALEALVRGDRRLVEARPAPAEALALADLRDVALFALSEPFLELRLAALG
jgi:tetratricopeptide repeat protein